MYANYTTVKPAHAVTSIKQSPVLKGHLWDKEKVALLFLCPKGDLSTQV